MEQDMLTLIVLGRPFLATAGCHIDVKSGKLSFDGGGDDHVEFNLFKASKFPSIFYECHMIDVVDSLMWKTVSNVVSNDSLEYLMLNDSTNKDENPEVALCAQYLEASPEVLPSQDKVEPLKVKEKPSSEEEQPPEVELKPLPSSFRYEFFGPISTYLVIVNAYQVNSLLTVIREHRKAIGYTLDDLKEIHPSVNMQRILMEDDYKPSIEHQRRLNANT